MSSMAAVFFVKLGDDIPKRVDKSIFSPNDNANWLYESSCFIVNEN